MARSTVPAMELHAGETILFQGHPSWRAALLFFVKGFVGAAVVGVILGLAVSTFAGIVAAGVIVGLTIFASIVVRSSTEYVITDERLHIRRGLLSKTIHETRLSRVQDVTVTQAVFERLLGIGRADFDTASADNKDFVFAGIEKPDQVRAAVDKAHRLAEARGLEPSGPGSAVPPQPQPQRPQGL